MRYLLAIVVPPAVAILMPGQRRHEILAVVSSAAVLFMVLVAAGLGGLLIMPFVMIALWIVAAVFACLDVSVYYREQKVQIISEGMQRAGSAPTTQAMPASRQIQDPANYDRSRDVYRL